uniref:PiggyBac transposable element-derived protein 4 n=1 Tax=Bactrocera dorsalis TaxID=27457 RepID=A0A034WD12_BACDO
MISPVLMPQQHQQSKQKNTSDKKPYKSLTIYTVDGMPVVKSSYSEIKTGETILKTSGNNHHLTKIGKPRMFGKCVTCLKRTHKNHAALSKITTYCPQCPGGVWMCEDCFDKAH